MFCDLLWSDPLPDEIATSKEYVDNEDRECSYLFGKKPAKKLLDSNNLMTIVNLQTTAEYRQYLLKQRAEGDMHDRASREFTTLYAEDSGDLMGWLVSNQNRLSPEKYTQFVGMVERRAAGRCAAERRSVGPWCTGDMPETWMSRRVMARCSWSTLPGGVDAPGRTAAAGWTAAVGGLTEGAGATPAPPSGDRTRAWSWSGSSLRATTPSLGWPLSGSGPGPARRERSGIRRRRPSRGSRAA